MPLMVAPMISTTIITVLLLLLDNFGYLTMANSRLYSVKQCYRELEKGRKFLLQIKHELIVGYHRRRQQHIQALLLKHNSTAIFNFPTNKINASICSSFDNTNDSSKNITGNNDGMTTLISWINEMHNYLSNEKDTCEGPEFHNITTITMPQLGSFFSLFLTNHGLPLCSICDRMFTKAENILFTTNSMKFTYTEQILYQFFLAHIPDIKMICSGLIPACHHYYKANALSITPAGKCAQCNICMATTTYIANRILLNQTAIDSIRNWITEQYLHQVCLQAYQLFPPNFYWNGNNYIYCMKWTRNFFYNLINRLTTNIIPENFCSTKLRWCKPYEIPSILDCLEEFCNESFPEQWQMTVCNFVSNGSINSTYFPQQQNAKQ